MELDEEIIPVADLEGAEETPSKNLQKRSVIISLYAHILWLRMQIFKKKIGSLRSPVLLIIL